MEEEDVDDTHICLKCRKTVQGLNNYVRHRKSECVGRKPVDAVVQHDVLLDIDHKPDLKADDFFSSLELQSSSKKPTTRNLGIRTRSKALATAPIPPRRDDMHIIDEILHSTASDGLVKKHEEPEAEYDDDSNEEYEDYEMLDEDDHAPPRSHTGGKWKPGGQRASPSSWSRPSSSAHVDEERGGSWSLFDNTSPAPPPTFTGGKWASGGKWTSGVDDEDEQEVAPDDVGGLWAGGRSGRHEADSLLMSPYRKSAVFWCGPCNRNLSSRRLYDKHLKSELHYRRTQPERELDEDFEPAKEPRNTANRGEGKRIIKKSKFYDDGETEVRKRKTETEGSPDASRKKKRKKRKEYVKCDVCSANVCSIMMGKHLVSHYHRRKAQRGDAVNEALIIANIHSVVRQAPFQCSPCKFYCHTMETFKLHWSSDAHLENDAKSNGRYWCSICKCACETSSDMADHFDSTEHKESILATNRSVPIVIQRRRPISCVMCDEHFQYNAELRRHCVRTLHPDFNSAEDQRFFCAVCKYRARSRRALQRHAKMAHRSEPAESFCSTCAMNFATAQEAAAHRRLPEHKSKVEEDRRARGDVKEKTRNCRECGCHFLSRQELKVHLKDEHPENVYSCPHCGEAFSFQQQLGHHIRGKRCFKEAMMEAIKTESCDLVAGSSAEDLFHRLVHGQLVYERVLSANIPVEQQRVIGKYPCVFCNKPFRKSALLGHLHTHLGDQPNMCAYCNKTFGYRSSLVKHVQRVHVVEAVDGRVYECEAPRCSHRATSMAALERHRLRHTDRPKPFTCDLCGGCFRQKHNLRQHIKLHTGKEFTCAAPGCVFQCRSQAELRNHQYVHSDARPFQCAACEYAAKTQAQLRRHQLIHEGVRNHCCPYCDFKSRMSTHLRRHIRIHTGAKPYGCPYCVYTCNNLENLRKHILTTQKHPGKKMYECKFCSTYATNAAREFSAHLVNAHGDSFSTAGVATSYITGLYDAENDPRVVDNPIMKKERKPTKKESPASSPLYDAVLPEEPHSMDGVLYIPPLPATTTSSSTACIHDVMPPSVFDHQYFHIGDLAGGQLISVDDVMLPLHDEEVTIVEVADK